MKPAQKKLRGILFLEKTFCQIAIENHPQIVTFQFPPTVVQDLEIINLEEFHKQFLAFLLQNKIPPVDFFMVLGNSLFFIKDLKATPKATPNPKPEEKTEATLMAPDEEEIQKFLTYVPFENVSFKVFKKEQLIRIMATNRDLFEAFKKSIEKQGGTIAVIIPSFAFEMYKGIKLGQSLSPQSERAIFHNIESIKGQSMLVNQEIDNDDDMPSKAVPEEVSPIHDPKKRIWAFVGIFGMLIVVLGYLVVTQFIMGGNKIKKETPPPPPPADQVEQVQASPIPTIASISATMKEAIQVQILSSARGKSAAIDLQKDLQASGYPNVKVSTSNAQVTSAQIVYKPTVDHTIQTDIGKLITNRFAENSAIENADAQFDVIVTIPSTNTASPSAQ
jgi:hypothetical protein